MDKKSDIIFKEEQKFAPWLLWLVLFSMIIAVVVIVFAIKTELAKDNPPDIAEFAFLICIGIILPLAISMLMFVFKLQTEVRDDGLYVRLFPLHIQFKKFIPADIEKAYARKYRPVAEYGGWGIKGSIKNRAYNTRGNEGLQLVLNDGKKLLIGSQKSQELEDAIKSIME